MKNLNRVIHTLPSLSIGDGGPPRSVSQLCGALCESDNEVGIVTAVEAQDPIVSLNPKIELTKLGGKGASFWERLSSANFTKALPQLHEKNPISLLHQQWHARRFRHLGQQKHPRIPMLGNKP